MLLRGQNLLGYRHYEDGVVERFVEKAAENGIDVFRIFDALNDMRNLQTEHQGREADRQARARDDLLYREPGAYRRGFCRDGPELQGDGLRFDLHKRHGRAAEAAAGLRPGQAIKEQCGEDTLVHVHTHATTGVTLVSLMKAVEAGCDMVDTAISSLSLGPGHNPTESLVEMLEGTGYETRVDLERVLKIKRILPRSVPAIRSFSARTRAWIRRSSRARFPAA